MVYQDPLGPSRRAGGVNNINDMEWIGAGSGEEKTDAGSISPEESNPVTFPLSKKFSPLPPFKLSISSAREAAVTSRLTRCPLIYIHSWPPVL